MRLFNSTNALVALSFPINVVSLATNLHARSHNHARQSGYHVDQLGLYLAGYDHQESEVAMHHSIRDLGGRFFLKAATDFDQLTNIRDKTENNLGQDFASDILVPRDALLPVGIYDDLQKLWRFLLWGRGVGVDDINPWYHKLDNDGAKPLQTEIARQPDGPTKEQARKMVMWRREIVMGRQAARFRYLKQGTADQAHNAEIVKANEALAKANAEYVKKGGVIKDLPATVNFKSALKNYMTKPTPPGNYLLPSIEDPNKPPNRPPPNHPPPNHPPPNHPPPNHPPPNHPPPNHPPPNQLPFHPAPSRPPPHHPPVQIPPHSPSPPKGPSDTHEMSPEEQAILSNEPKGPRGPRHPGSGPSGPGLGGCRPEGESEGGDGCI